MLCLQHSILFPHNSDKLLVFVLRGWEDDAGTSSVPHFTDVGPTASNQELVVLWLGMQLHRVVVDLLKGEGHTAQRVKVSSS